MTTGLRSFYLATGMLIGLALTGCGGNEFGLMGEENGFSQSTSGEPVPIDILWVVDNSGSMETSQALIAANASSFMNKFKATHFDFQIAVVTTEAYRALPMFTGNNSYSRFKDGNASDGASGYRIINRDTPNMEQVFSKNFQQGIAGSGDERGFQSLEAALTNPDNRASFPRAGAFLAVIFLTDEEDFSWNGTANIQLNPDGSPASNTDPRLYAQQRYLDFLDEVTSSTADKRNYIVNTIAIFDQACLDDLSTEFTGRRRADRYAVLSEATGGVTGSLCDPFDGILSNITDTILQYSTKFYLTRLPNLSTLQVFVNNVLVPSEGYVYSAADNSITFEPAHIPPSGAKIIVRFTPTELKD